MTRLATQAGGPDGQNEGVPIVERSLGWALVKPTMTAEEYVPVKILRKGKRFTFVETLGGTEWRFTTRGLWELPSYEAAQAEIDKMRAYRLTKAKARQS